MDVIERMRAAIAAPWDGRRRHSGAPHGVGRVGLNGARLRRLRACPGRRARDARDAAREPPSARRGRRRRRRLRVSVGRRFGNPPVHVRYRCGRRSRRTGGNVEAVARSERYLAANEALESLCRHAGAPLSSGRIFTAHTADDRVESFYMRSIVGTGPGGFRAMRYENGPIARPLLDVGREDLRDYLRKREQSGEICACDAQGNLWREDATNAHTDHFRAFVRHEIVPRAKERNPQLLETLGRTMDLIADEDDFMEGLAAMLRASTSPGSARRRVATPIGRRVSNCPRRSGRWRFPSPAVRLRARFSACSALTHGLRRRPLRACSMRSRISARKAAM